MKFDPLTDAQLDAEKAERLKAFLPLPKGVYSFEVIFAEDKISKAGKEMIELTLRIWASDGTMHEIRDWLTTGFLSKLKHFCYVTGLEEQYEAGTLTAGPCMYKTGMVMLDIDKGKPDPNGGVYPDRNKVVDYVADQLKEAKLTAIANKETFDSTDIPF